MTNALLCIHVWVWDESLRLINSKTLHTKSRRFHLLHDHYSAALCNDSVDINNGMVTFNGISVGDMATYTCDLGFELVGATATTCTLVDTDSAEFQPAPPSCIREYTE